MDVFFLVTRAANRFGFAAFRYFQSHFRRGRSEVEDGFFYMVANSSDVGQRQRVFIGRPKKIGLTYAFSAAHDGPELAIICFDPGNPGNAIRHLL